MGLSSSKQKTRTNQTTSETGTMTPTNPQWVVDSTKGFTDKVNAFGERDSREFIAGPSDLQRQAWSSAPQQLGGWRDGLANATGMAEAAGNRATSLGAAEGYTAQNADAERGYGLMAEYQNPYTEQVVDATLADFDHNAGQVRAAQAADAARNGAFRGSRFALREAHTEGELGRGRAATAATLRDRGFNTAAGLGMQDADRLTNTSMFNTGQQNQAAQFGASARNQFSLADAQLQEQAAQRQLAAAGLIGNLGQSTAEHSRQDLGLMADLGTQQRGVEQAIQAGPLAMLEMQGNLLANQPYNLFQGRNITSNGTMQGTTTQKNSPSLFSQLLAGASMFG